MRYQVLSTKDAQFLTPRDKQVHLVDYGDLSCRTVPLSEALEIAKGCEFGEKMLSDFEIGRKLPFCIKTFPKKCGYMDIISVNGVVRFYFNGKKFRMNGYELLGQSTSGFERLIPCFCYVMPDYVAVGFRLGYGGYVSGSFRLYFHRSFVEINNEVGITPYVKVDYDFKKYLPK